MAEAPDNNPNNGAPNRFDFAFILTPAKVLTSAIEAFCDPKLNSEKEALITVGPNGCEISVWYVDMETGNEIFAMLQLKSSFLEGFQCTNLLRKMLPLTGLSRVLRAADSFQPESVAIFVEEGSSRISFQWGTSALDFALGRPVNIDLEIAELGYEDFPDVSYMYETVVPSKDLTTIMTKLPEDTTNGAQSVEMKLRPEIGEGASTSQSQEHYIVTMEWSFWESLESASRIADNCCVYLIREPQKFIMLSFKMEDVGEMVYLNEAEFISVPALPPKDHFGSLHH